MVSRQCTIKCNLTAHTDIYYKKKPFRLCLIKIRRLLRFKNFKMGSVFYNKNQKDIVSYMSLYFKQKDTDCSLFSNDGYEFPIHKVSCIFTSSITQACNSNLILGITLSNKIYVGNCEKCKIGLLSKT